ncbi:hypothetical protein HAX54_043652, partial [Datura stramonium]|nr:hypothetical protein [Datura stramonium]
EVVLCALDSAISRGLLFVAPTSIQRQYGSNNFDQIVYTSIRYPLEDGPLGGTYGLEHRIRKFDLASLDSIHHSHSQHNIDLDIVVEVSVHYKKLDVIWQQLSPQMTERSPLKIYSCDYCSIGSTSITK